ncbi:MAG TPA: glutathione-disulfide reductase [Caulobacterales bacterium]|nr:glutathione-disulfide reductase [Caulobacterales bacterium]
MAQFDYDLFVIGAGSAGTRAARLAALCGARTAVAEEYRIGGTCVIRGCVPKKLLVYASEFGQSFHDAKGFGWTVEWARFDWATLRENVQDEVARLSGLYRRNLERAGVGIYEDRVTVLDANTVRLAKSGATYSAERILVATGARPLRGQGVKGGELAITSNEAFLLDALPNRILIAGGGYIAVEFASIFSGLGVETTLAYRGDLILRGFDDDVRRYVQAELERTGVKIITQAAPVEIAPLESGKLVSLSNKMRLEVDEAMLALGRAPNTEALGLEKAGVRLTERGAVAVDVYSRSSVPSIFAIGDVTDRISLTPVAIREAQAFAESEFYGRPVAFDHADVPSAVFGRPPIGAVGLTEAAARAQFGDVHIYKTAFRPMKHIVAGNDQKTLMKLVVHPKDDRVLGVHIAGADAPEMIQLAAIAVKAKLTKTQWDATCALHPTAAEELVLLRERSA